MSCEGCKPNTESQINNDSVFIDDERATPAGYNVTLRTVHAVKEYLKQNGLPRRISCDYYLDYGETGDDVVDIIERQLITGELVLPERFKFRGHSDCFYKRAHLSNRMADIIAEIREIRGINE